ncbi:uncharacterized protein BJ171DRAFT_630773 [Polychytrium aggregatum]|uniref:uncharacterized protein n=1 Tax=Polychytrium aggregatum TaxID=110093 RepID=UPI0022FEBF9C|nr:uncharacterized protein BJ171DRAFT_630773 [Polychytrium aggregatum]KAI9199637.1 hypothetical protein BJ171DRAFT_630773 [Polychytrium aggregatum]
MSGNSPHISVEGSSEAASPATLFRQPLLTASESAERSGQGLGLELQSDLHSSSVVSGDSISRFHSDTISYEAEGSLDRDSAGDGGLDDGAALGCDDDEDGDGGSGEQDHDAGGQQQSSLKSDSTPNGASALKMGLIVDLELIALTDKERHLRLARVLNKRHSRVYNHIHQFFRINVALPDQEPFMITVDKDQTIEYLAKQIEAEYAFRFSPEYRSYSQLPQLPLLPSSKENPITSSDDPQPAPDIEATDPKHSNFAPLSQPFHRSMPKLEISSPRDSSGSTPVANDLGSRHSEAKLIQSKPADISHDDLLSQRPLDHSSRASTPLEISQVYVDSGMLALRFTDKIGEVLCFNDTVSIINTFEAFSPRRRITRSQKDTNAAKSQPNLLTRPVDKQHRSQRSTESMQKSRESMQKSSTESSSNLGLSNASTPHKTSNQSLSAPRSSNRVRNFSLIPNPTLDDRFQAVLHSKLFLQYFAEFCAEQYAIENLLFWLEVEIFQSCESVENIHTYAKFIYHTFIALDAPLKVNISSEIQKDVQWPLPTPPDTVDLSIFDEAQEQVYAMLKAHSFVRFEASQKYIQMLDARNIDRAAYNSGKIKGFYGKYYIPNIEFAANMVGLSEEGVSKIDLGSSGPQQRESIMNRILHMRFQNSVQVAEDYFNEIHRLSWAQKQVKMMKEKKLSRFFGMRPSNDQLHHQTPKKAVESRLKYEKRDSIMESPEMSSPPALAPENDSHIRRKKKEKLETFFGNKLPRNQKRVQKIVKDVGDGSVDAQSEDGDGGSSEGVSDDNRGSDESSDSSECEMALPAGPTLNELDASQRRILTKRAKKIKNMFGESLKETTVQEAITQPVIDQRSKVYIETAPSPTTTSPAVTDQSPVSSPLRLMVPGLGQGGRTISTDSIATVGAAAISATHSVSTENLSLETKEIKKKRLDKLSAFLGERIDTNRIEEAQASAASIPKSTILRPLTHQEKKQYQKKSSKLERILGALPPVDMLSKDAAPVSSTLSRPSQSPLTESGLKLRQQIVRISLALQGSSDISALFSQLDDAADEDRSPYNSDADTDGSTDRLRGNTSSRSSLAGSPAAHTVAEVKGSRQRKVKKLRRIFGETLDFETLFLKELEQAIVDHAATEEESNFLKEDVENLRQLVRKLSRNQSSLDPKKSSSQLATDSPKLSRMASPRASHTGSPRISRTARSDK